MEITKKVTENLQILQEQPQSLSPQELKELLETIFSILENRINQIPKNNNQAKNITSLINIKHYTLDSDFLFKVPTDKYKQNILKEILTIWQNLVILSFEEKVKLIMEYTETENIPKDKSLTFSMIKENTFDNTSILKWYSNQIQNNYQDFALILKKYKPLYKEAYKKLKLNPKLEQMTICFMTYIENNDIPITQSNLTFGDIGSSIKKNTIVSYWLRNNLFKNQLKFMTICQKYATQYPKAYSKIKTKLEKYQNKLKYIPLSFEERVKLIIEYLNNTSNDKISSDLLFKDLSSNNNDLKKVEDWFAVTRNKKLVELLKQIELYKEEYPLGYNRITTRISTLKENKNKHSLTQEELLKIYLKYINNHPIPLNETLKFKDIDPNITDERYIKNWSLNKIYTTMENVYIICKNYKTTYPQACSKIIDRMTKLELYREKNEYNLTQDEKIKIFMKYIETNAIPPQKSHLRFCDIDPTIKDECQVGAWLRDRLNRDITSFYLKCQKYKEIYPNAYIKLESRIEQNQTKTQIVPLTFADRIKSYMAYYNQTEDYYLDRNLRFYDIEPNTNDETSLWSWFKRNIINNTSQTLTECAKYIAIYPKAYQKIIFLQEDFIDKAENYSKKVLIILKYHEQNILPPRTQKITFNQLDPSINSNQNIAEWFHTKLRYGQKKLLTECLQYSDIYPNAIEKIKNEIEKINTAKMKPTLNYTERIEILMNYLETRSLSSLTSLNFSDLVPNTRRNANIANWIQTQIKSNIDKFITEYTKYQKIYPQAYQKLTTKINNYCQKKEKTYLNKEQRIPLLMSYLENYDLNKDNKNLRFCQISEVEDDTLVYSWYANVTFKNTYWFFKEIEKYQTIYPKAYQKICNQINKSSKKLINQRILLLEELTKIKASKETKQIKKLVK